MKRVAFTIVFNGKNHLLHNGFIYKMPDMFDKWVIIDGLALTGGSTGWCKVPDKKFDNNGRSTDGTVELVGQITSTHNNVKSIIPVKPWESKDKMVNSAVSLLKAEKAYLWQIDVDEQWDATELANAEKMLEYINGDCGMFLCNYHIKNGLIAKGEWGEGKKQPYIRLWKWGGQDFKTHEPPELIGGNGKAILLPQRFEHYAYYFDSDVLFKQEYYPNCKNLTNKLDKINASKIFPVHVRHLIDGYWGETDTWIYKKEYL
jgi:hypothetical protein